MNITKRFFKDSIIYSLQPILVQGITFLLLPLYTKFLTPSDYGSLNYILMYSTFFGVFCAMGLGSSFWKFKLETSGYLLADLIKITLIIQLVTAVFIFLILLICNYFFFNNRLFYEVLLALVVEIFAFFYSLGLLLFRANFEIKRYLVTTIIFTVISVLLNFVTVSIFALNYLGIILSSLLSNLILGIIVLRYYFKYIKVGKYNKKLAFELIKYGFPLMIANLIFIFLSLSDRFLVRLLGGDIQLGLYTFGAKFGNLINVFIISPFFLAWNPIRWEIFEKSNGKEIFASFYRMLIILLPMIAALFCAFSIMVIKIVTLNDDFLKGIYVIPYLVFAQVFYGLYYFNMMGLIFTDQTPKISYIIFFCALASIILNYILLPKFGFIGAGISAIIVYFLLYASTAFYSQKLYPIKRYLRIEIIQIMEIFILAIVFSYCYNEIENLYLLTFTIFAISILIFLINISLKLFSINDFKEIIRNLKR